MIYLGADHRGFQLKEKIKRYLEEQGLPFEDLGAFLEDKDDDFTEYAHKVAQAVAIDSNIHRGIVICGSGVGVDVVANKEKGIISGLFFNPRQAIDATGHDHVNVAALPSDHISLDEATAIVMGFLTTPYSHEERHERRVREIKNIDKYHE